VGGGGRQCSFRKPLQFFRTCHKSHFNLKTGVLGEKEERLKRSMFCVGTVKPLKYFDYRCCVSFSVSFSSLSSG
jgi:hypothetical protein